MKRFIVSATFLALTNLSIAQDNLVKAGNNGVAYVDGPPAPAVTVIATATAPPVVVEEKVYVPPSSNPYQPPPGHTGPPPIPSTYTTPAAQAPPPPASSAGLPPPSTPSAPSPSSPSGGAQSGNGQICINFSGGDFHFANAGSWPAKTGSGAQAASQCFDMVAGGAMFICESECNASGDAAPAKYTKLECNFAGGYPNCDISLVDGFSLPLECTIPGASPEKIGGTADLGSSCPTPGGDGTCANSQGYNNAGSASAPPVDQYFLAANTNDPNQPGPKGNYCVWQYCSGPSDSFWNPKITPTISCQVGSRSQASKKRSDGVIETRNVSEVEMRAIDDSLAAEDHLRRHVGGAHSHARAHARSLKAVLV